MGAQSLVTTHCVSPQPHLNPQLHQNPPLHQSLQLHPPPPQLKPPHRCHPPDHQCHVTVNVIIHSNSTATNTGNVTRMEHSRKKLVRETWNTMQKHMPVPIRKTLTAPGIRSRSASLIT